MTRTIVDARTELENSLGPVRRAMTSDVLSLEAGCKASIAARELESRHVSGAPVVEHGILVGMISMKDLGMPASPQTTGPFLRLEHRLADFAVREVMSRNVVTADPDWPLWRAAETMVTERVNRLPVVDALRRPVGLITRDDIVRRLAEAGRGDEEP